MQGLIQGEAVQLGGVLADNLPGILLGHVLEGALLPASGTHPGGEVTGAPGHNAAHAILRSLKLEEAYPSD